MKNICCIYKITSPSNKIYIGQTKNMYKRMQKYKYKCFDQPRIYNSLKKYGWENHIFDIIEICNKSELNEREKYYIHLYDTFNTDHGMNLTDGGDSKVFTLESIEKIRQSKLGVKRSEETRRKISESKKGVAPHINSRHSSGEYEIYDNNNILVAKFKSNVKAKLKELNLPSYSFCRSYRTNTKIDKGIYAGWYSIKL